MPKYYIQEEVSKLVLSNGFIEVFKNEALSIAAVYFNLILISDDFLLLNHNGYEFYCKYKEENSSLMFMVKEELMDLITSYFVANKTMEVEIDYDCNSKLNKFIVSELKKENGI